MVPRETWVGLMLHKDWRGFVWPGDAARFCGAHMRWTTWRYSLKAGDHVGSADTGPALSLSNWVSLGRVVNFTEPLLPFSLK